MACARPARQTTMMRHSDRNGSPVSATNVVHASLTWPKKVGRAAASRGDARPVAFIVIAVAEASRMPAFRIRAAPQRRGAAPRCLTLIP